MSRLNGFCTFFTAIYMGFIFGDITPFIILLCCILPPIISPVNQLGVILGTILNFLLWLLAAEGGSLLR